MKSVCMLYRKEIDILGFHALAVRGICTCAILSASLSISSCARKNAVTDVRTSVPYRPLLINDSARAAPRISGPIVTAQERPRTIVSIVSPTVSSLLTGDSNAVPRNIELNFVSSDIREITSQILGTDLRLNFSIDPSIHGTATLVTTTPVSKAQLLPILQSILIQTGATITEWSGIYNVVPATAAGGLSTISGTAGGRLVSLRFAAAEDLVKALSLYTLASAHLIAVPSANAIIVSGDPIQRDSLVELINAFDVDMLSGQSYALFPVSFGAATDFADSLKQALRTQSGGTLSNVLRVIPIPRVNAILVTATNPKFIEDARRVFAMIERGRWQTMRTWHVYYLQNGTANDIAYTLQQAFTPGTVTAQPTARASGQAGSAFPSSQGSSGISTASAGEMSGPSIGGGSTAGAMGLGSAAVPSAAAEDNSNAAAAGVNPLLGGIGNNGSSGTTDRNEIRIISNPNNNAILCYATGEEEDTIEAMLRKIDILPLQVRIDAVIAEVTLNDNLTYGTQFFFKHHSLNGGLIQSAATTSLSPNALPLPGSTVPNFVFNVSGQDGDIVIQALQAITTVKVLSAPELLVLDNETASLQVGNQVPISNGTLSTANNTAAVINSTSYVTTGVITQVTPRVNSGGLVTLDVRQEVSSVVPQNQVDGSSGSSIQSPTFTDRAVKSRVVVQDGQTVGLAGLITDNVNISNSGLPILKDIPVIGALFSNQANTRSRTELLILLTPHVLHDPRDTRALTEDLRDQVPKASALSYELSNLKAAGADSPGRGIRVRSDLQN